MFPKIPVSQDPKGAGEGPWRGRGGAEAGEAGEIGEAGEAGEARKTYVSVSCLIIKNTGEEGNRLLLGAQSYARAQKGINRLKMVACYCQRYSKSLYPCCELVS